MRVRKLSLFDGRQRRRRGARSRTGMRDCACARLSQLLSTLPRCSSSRRFGGCRASSGMRSGRRNRLRWSPWCARSHAAVARAAITQPETMNSRAGDESRLRRAAARSRLDAEQTAETCKRKCQTRASRKERRETQSRPSRGKGAPPSFFCIDLKYACLQSDKVTNCDSRSSRAHHSSKLKVAL